MRKPIIDDPVYVPGTISRVLLYIATCALCYTSHEALAGDMKDAAKAFHAEGWGTKEDVWYCPTCMAQARLKVRRFDDG